VAIARIFDGADLHPSGSQPTRYFQPARRIFSKSDMDAWSHSAACGELSGFLEAMCDAVSGVRVTDPCHLSPAVEAVLGLLDTLEGWLTEFPATPQSAALRGQAPPDPIYRKLLLKLSDEAGVLSEGLLGNDTGGAGIELEVYLREAFGDPIGLTLGIAHELSFLIWLLSLSKLQVFTQRDLPAIAGRVCSAYFKVTNLIQTQYRLVNNSSGHGLWGLEEFRLVAFVLGAAQLRKHKFIKPRSIFSAEVLEGFSEQYIYLQAITAVQASNSSGVPFSERSPALCDISALRSWTDVHTGLMRMFESEVLRQHAVVQNLRFGAIFAADWESSRTANEEQHCAQFDEGWVGPSGVQGSDCDQMAAPGESAPLETITGVAPWSASFQAPILSMRHYFNDFPLSPRKSPTIRPRDTTEIRPHVDGSRP